MQKCLQHENKTLKIRNVSWPPNQYIWMISEGLCDADDWSNGLQILQTPNFWLVFTLFSVFSLFFMSGFLLY